MEGGVARTIYLIVGRSVGRSADRQIGRFSRKERSGGGRFADYPLGRMVDRGRGEGFEFDLEVRGQQLPRNGPYFTITNGSSFLRTTSVAR